MKELDATAKEELMAELAKLQQEMEDLDEEKRAFLGQTGVHIGVGLLKSRRRQYQREEETLRGRLAAIKAQLEE